MCFSAWMKRESSGWIGPNGSLTLDGLYKLTAWVEAGNEAYSMLYLPADLQEGGQTDG